MAYAKYIRHHHGMFDYLLLGRSFRCIFESRFSALRFDVNDDIIVNLLVTMGIGELISKMKHMERSNTKSMGALEVEAMRCANLMKRPGKDGVLALSSVISENSSLQDEIWTERYIGDTPAFTSDYRRNLRNTLDWSERDIEILFKQSDPKGRNVEEISTALIDKLNQLSPSNLPFGI